MVPTYLGATVTRRYFFLSVDGPGSLNIGEGTLSFKSSQRREPFCLASPRLEYRLIDALTAEVPRFLAGMDV
jgi:hypothetical protein